MLPHAIALFFVSALGSLLLFLTFWSILFTKRYPERWFNWFVEQMRWDTRITTYLLFMSTDYPPLQERRYTKRCAVLVVAAALHGERDQIGPHF